MKRIRVLLVDPHTLFREGMKVLLENEETIEIVGEAATAEQAIPLVRTLAPNVVLLETARNQIHELWNGAMAVRRLREVRPEANIAFLTEREDQVSLMEYVQSGAAGYILKETRLLELCAAIRTLARGGNYVSSRILASLSEAADRQAAGPLTNREHEVLRLTAQGHSVREIAVMLDLSAKTVDAHKVNLMRKLHIHNKAQLVHYAFENNILRLSGAG